MILRESLLPKYVINETNFRNQHGEISIFLQTEVDGTSVLAEKYTEFFQSRYLDQPKCGVNDKKQKKYHFHLV
jgi:hypothetical protein